VAGLASTKIITQSRELMLGRLASIELGSQAVGLFTTVAFAWWRPSVLALVVGGIAGNAVRAALSHLILPGERDRFGWDAAAVRHVVHFGKWLFLSTLLTFVAGQSDRLVFGKLIPLNLLGVYSIAAMISSVPLQLVSHVGASVVFPWYSREKNQGGELAAIVGRVRPRVLLVGGFLISCLLASGDALIATLYDARYSEAGWIVRLLSLACWFGMLEATNGVALLAHGSPRWVALGSAAKVVAMTATIPIGYRLGAFPGAVVGLVVSELARYAVSARASATIGIRNLAHDFGFSAAIAVTAGAAALLPDLGGAGGIHALPRVVAGAAIAVLVWLPLALRALSAAKAELAT
jgi:O-antigen/teichoic acid export membrane protein